MAEIRERGFRIVVDYGYSAASFVLPLVVGPLGVEAISAHGFFAEARRARVARAGDRAHEAARDGDRRRPRRGLRPVRAALPRRRAGARGAGRPDPSPLRAPPRRPRRRRPRRPSRSPSRAGRDARRERARDHSHPELALRPDPGGVRRRRRLRGRGRWRLRLPGVPARLRRDREPREAARAARAHGTAALRARRRVAGADADPPPPRLPWAKKGTVMRVLNERLAGRDSTSRTGSS